MEYLNYLLISIIVLLVVNIALSGVCLSKLNKKSENYLLPQQLSKIVQQEIPNYGSDMNASM